MEKTTSIFHVTDDEGSDYTILEITSSDEAAGEAHSGTTRLVTKDGHGVTECAGTYTIKKIEVSGTREISTHRL